MIEKEDLGYTGAALLAAGAFAPILHMPILGSTNLIVKEEGVFIIICAIIMAIFVYKKLYKAIIFASSAIFIFITITFINFNNEISALKAESPLEILSSSTQLGFGWLLLFIAPVLLIIFSKEFINTVPCPHCGKKLSLKQTTCIHCRRKIVWVANSPLRISRKIESSEEE